MSIKTTPGIDVSLDVTELTTSPAQSIDSSANRKNIDVEAPNEIKSIKKEYSIIGDIFYAGMNSDIAPTWLTNLINAVVGTSVANGLVNYDLLVQDVRSAIDSIDVASNTYVEQINFTSSVDSIVGTHLTTLNATIDGKFATIVDLDIVKVDADSALTLRATDLQAEFTADISSQITTVQQAFASADLSLANDITSLTTAFTNQESNLSGTADAVSGLQTYVGLSGESSPNGTGMLSRIGILEKQNDGIIEYTVDTYDVMIGIEDPNNDTGNDQLDVTKEPYVSWKAADVTGGTEETRAAHTGDVYIMYSDDVNGTRTYIRSYKFIKTAADATSPYTTDTEGYGWAVVSDTDAQAAYAIALQAKDLADSKRRVFVVEPFAPYDKGDLWVDSSVSPQLIKVAGTAAVIPTAFDSGHWALADEYAKNFVDSIYTPDSAQLHRQADGKVEYYFYESYTDVALATSEATALSIIDDAWTTQELRDAANGDVVYFKDTENAYWYQASTPAWLVITDTSIYAALKNAATAQGAADGKVSQFFAWGGVDAPQTYDVVLRPVEYVTNEYGDFLDTNSDVTVVPAEYVVLQSEEKATIEAADFIYWFLNSALYRKGATGWGDKVAIPTTAGDGSYISEGDVVTVFDPVDNDITVYSFNGTSWQTTGPDGILSKSKFFVDLENAVTGPNGIAKAVANLAITSSAYTDGETSKVESKFDYNSVLTMGGLQYNSGFGLNSTGVSHTGETFNVLMDYFAGEKVFYNGNTYVAKQDVAASAVVPIAGANWKLTDGLSESSAFDSEFWVNAERFVLKSPRFPGIEAAFSVTATGISLSTKYTDANRTVPTGPYNFANPYIEGDLVTVNGSSYIAVQDVPASSFVITNTTYWELFAAAAKALRVKSDKQIFTKNGLDAYDPATQLITFSYDKENLTDTTIVWTSTVAGTDNGSTYTISQAQMGANTAVTVTITADTDSFSDSITVPVLLDGSPAVTGILSNATHIVASSSLGIVLSGLPESGTDVSVYEGATVMTYVASAPTAGQWTISSYTASGVTRDTATVVNNTTYATTAGIDALAANTGSLVLHITGKSSEGVDFTLALEQSFSKVLQGIAGSYSDFWFIRKAAGTTPTDPDGADTWVTNVTAVSSGAGNLWTIRADTDSEGTVTYVDKRRIDADIVRELTLFSPATTGNAPTAPTSTYDFSAVPASALTGTAGWLTSLPTISNKDEKIYAITALAAGNITETAKSITWSSATVYAQRTDGVAAKGLILSSTAYYFRESEGEIQDPATITLSANLQNITGDVVWTLVPDIGTSSGSTHTITKAQFAGVDTLSVKAEVGSYYDTFTIVKLKDGSGVITPIISNENHTLTADPSGVVSDYTGSGTSLRLFEGTTELTWVPATPDAGEWTIEGTPTDIVVGAPSLSGIHIVGGDVSAMTNEADTATIIWTFAGKSKAGVDFDIDITQTFSKSKQGITGVSYTGTTEYYKLTNSDTAPTVASGSWLTAPQSPTSGSRYLWNYNKNSKSDATYADSPVSLVTQYVEDGRGITSVVETYQISSSSSTAPTGTWETGFAGAGTLTDAFPYMWNKTVVNYNLGTLTETKYTLIAAKGITGVSGKGSDYWFKRASSAPTDTPSTDGSDADGWYTDLGSSSLNAAGDLYTIKGTKAEGVLTWTFGSPTLSSKTDVREITLYAGPDADAIALPTGSTYNFSTNALSIGTNPGGWSTSIPSILLTGQKVYVTTAIIYGNTTETAVAVSWDTAATYAQRTDGVTPDALTVSSDTVEGVTTLTFSDGTTATIDDGESSGVKIIYADDTSGTNASFTQGTRKFANYFEWTGAAPASVPGSLTYTLFIGVDGDSSGVQPVYADDASGTGATFTYSSQTFVNFYEWSVTAPVAVPEGLTYVKFVGADGINTNMLQGGHAERISSAYGFYTLLLGYVGEDFSAGDTLTVSGDLKVNQEAKDAGASSRIYLYNDGWANSVSVDTANTTYERVSATLTVPSDAVLGVAYHVNVYHFPNTTSTGLAYAKNLKVEVGGIATAYVRAAVSYVGTTEYYKLTNSSTAPTVASGSWLTTPQTPTSGSRYLWNYNKNSKSDATSTDSPVSLITQYVSDGRGITGIAETYQRGSSPSSEPTAGTWETTFLDAGTLTEALPYMWNKTVTSFSSGTLTETKYTLIAAKGAKGIQGIEGPVSTTLGPTGLRGTAFLSYQIPATTLKAASDGMIALIAQYWNAAAPDDKDEEKAGDVILITNPHDTAGWSHVYTYGTSWTADTAFIVNGSQIVTGTLSAAAIGTGALILGGIGYNFDIPLDIKDSSGVSLLQVNSADGTLLLSGCEISGIDSITNVTLLRDDVRAQLNPHYIPGGGSSSNQDSGTLNDGDESTALEVTAGKVGSKIGVSYNLSQNVIGNQSSDYSDPVWQVQIQKKIGTGDWSNLGSSTPFTGTHSDGKTPFYIAQDDSWEPGRNGHYSISCSGSITYVTADAGDHSFRVVVTKTSGSATSLAVTLIEAGEAAFEENIIDTDAVTQVITDSSTKPTGWTGNSWRDKETGFTIKWGTITKPNDDIPLTVYFADSFISVPVVSVSYKNYSGGSWAAGVIYTSTTGYIMVMNVHYASEGVLHWVATGIS